MGMGVGVGVIWARHMDIKRFTTEHVLGVFCLGIFDREDRSLGVEKF